jgi:hypothetical protein
VGDVPPSSGEAVLSLNGQRSGGRSPHFLLLLAVLVALGACTAGGNRSPTGSVASSPNPSRSASAPRPVVIDTDMAADDWLAILSHRVKALADRACPIASAVTVVGWPIVGRSTA